MLKFLIHRPIAVLMTFLGAIVLGLVVSRVVPISLLPDVPIPQITVQISYPNSSARVLENSAVRLLRNQLMQVNHLKDIHSRTRDNYATIDLELEYKTNTNLAFLEVNEKIDQIMGTLPRDLPRPIVLKTNASDVPVYYLSIFPKDTNGHFDLELSEFSRSVLKRRIEQLPEVAFVDRTGYAEPQILIKPNQSMLRSLGLTDGDIQQALVENNINLGNIILKDGQYQYQVEFLSELRSREEVENIYLQAGDQTIKLHTIAEVMLTPQPRRGLHLYGKRQAILFTIRKQANAQLFALQAAFDTLLHQLASEYPQLSFQVTNDQSEILRVSISNLRISLLYGGGFAFVLMFLFYRQWKSPVLIGMAIPISLILCLLAFYLIGLSINIISLAGLILGVGLMIDNAIIVIENIHQYHRMGLSMREASVKGANEVIRPLISSALTTCSVFLPLVFLSGLAGALFYDQALSITLALGCSLIVAYFLLPVLLGLGKTKARADARYASLYARTVDVALHYKWLVLPAFLLFSGAGYFIYTKLPKSTFPNLTRNAYVLKIDWNKPIRVEESQARISRMLTLLAEDLEASNAFIGEKQFLLLTEEQGIHEAEILLYLKYPEQTTNVIDHIYTYLGDEYPTATFSVKPLENLFDKMFAHTAPGLVAHIQDNEQNITPDPAEMQPIARQLAENNIILADPPLQEGYVIRLLLDQIQLYQIDHQIIYDKLKTLFNQHQISQLRTTDRYIPINLGTDDASLQELVATAEVPNQSGQYLPLQHFISVHQVQSPKTITAGKAGESLDFAFPVYHPNLVNAIKAAVQTTKRHSVHFSGQYFEDQRTIRELTLIVTVSLLLLFLILAAQFESLIQPLIVMLTVPVGISGSLLFLHFFDESLNIIAMIGIIVMSGIVVNDAILKIDMMNRARKSHSLVQAIHIGGQRRLKPIIMTSLTTILALTPVLLTGGLGSELQRPLAIAVIGGLITGTIASLYFVPLVYQMVIALGMRRKA